MGHEVFSKYIIEQVKNELHWHRAPVRPVDVPRFRIGQCFDILRDARNHGAISQEEYLKLVENSGKKKEEPNIIVPIVLKQEMLEEKLRSLQKRLREEYAGKGEND